MNVHKWGDTNPELLEAIDVQRKWNKMQDDFISKLEEPDSSILGGNNPLLANMRDRFATCLLIAELKNADYANGDDAFQNFRRSTVVGVPVDRAILVRLMDKLARISNLLDKEANVEDETINDSINDAINYLAILGAWIKRDE